MVSTLHQCRPAGGVARAIIAAYDYRLDRYRQAVRALVRAKDPEQRQKLAIPWEYNLYIRCRNNETLPLSGGILEQPILLMRAFSLIDLEKQSWKTEQGKIKDLNRQLKEEHERKQDAVHRP